MRPCEFRPTSGTGDAADSVGQLGPIRLAEEVERIQQAAQFEQGRALTACARERIGEGGAAIFQLVEGVSAHAHQLGVMKVHPRLIRVVQGHLQPLARLRRLTGGYQETADNRVVKGEVAIEVDEARPVHLSRQLVGLGGQRGCVCASGTRGQRLDGSVFGSADPLPQVEPRLLAELAKAGDQGGRLLNLAGLQADPDFHEVGVCPVVGILWEPQTSAALDRFSQLRFGTVQVAADHMR